MQTILSLPFFLFGFFFPFKSSTQTSASHITFFSTREKTKATDFLCLSLDAVQSQSQSNHQLPVTCLGPFTPVFKQRLDQIMKGILWHGFLFIAETQLSDPTSLFHSVITQYMET